MDIGTPYGLALASGVNAYLPLLSFAIAVRWFHLYEVNPNFAYITQDWFMLALLVLAIADLVADKIPVVDHFWDMIHTVIRPIAGAIVAAAASSSQVPGAKAIVGSSIPVSAGAIFSLANSSPVLAGGIGLLVALLIGGALAGMVHATKATTRIASTATTVGLFNAGLSIIEDVMVVIAIFLSLLAPAIMAIVIALFVLFFLWLLPRIFRVFGRRRRRIGI